MLLSSVYRTRSSSLLSLLQPPANSSARIVWTPNVQYHIHRSPPPVPCPCKMLHNVVNDYGEEQPAPQPTLKMEGHLLSDVCACFSIYSQLHSISAGRSSNRNLRTRHADKASCHINCGVIKKVKRRNFRVKGYSTNIRQTESVLKFVVLKKISQYKSNDISRQQTVYSIQQTVYSIQHTRKSMQQDSNHSDLLYVRTFILSRDPAVCLRSIQNSTDKSVSL